MVSLSLVALVNLKFSHDVDSLIDSGFETYAMLGRYREAFDDKASVLLLVRASDGGELLNEDLCSLRDWTDSALESGAIRRAFTPYQVQRAFLENGRIRWRNLIGDVCAHTNDRIQFPLRVFADSPFNGIINGKGGVDTLLSFNLAIDGNNAVLEEAKTLRALQSSFDTTLARRSRPLEGLWTGVSQFNASAMQANLFALFLNGVALLLLLTLFWVHYRSWRIPALFILSLFISNTVLHGLMAAFGSPYDLLSYGILLSVVMATHEDFVMVLHSVARGEPVSEAFRRWVYPSFLTSLTTILGFGSLAIVELATVRRFGIYMALGALLEWLALFFFLPALLQLLAPLNFNQLSAHFANQPKRWPGSVSALARRNHFISSNLKIKPRTVRIASWIVAVLTLMAAGYQMTKVKFEYRPTALFPYDHMISRATRAIMASHGFELDVSLIYRPEKEAQMSSIIQAIRHDPIVTKVEAPSEILADVTKPLPPNYASAVRDMLLLAKSDTSQRYISNDLGKRAIVYLRDTNLLALEKFRKRVVDLCREAHCELVGPLIAFAEFGEKVIDAFSRSLATGSLLVAAALALVSLSARLSIFDTFAVLICSFWGSAAVLALYVFSGLSINFVTLLIFSGLLSLAGDNAIFLILYSRHRNLAKNVTELMGASALVGLTLAVLSLTFCFSAYEPVRTLGAFLGVGFTLNFIGDNIMLKAMANRHETEFNDGRLAKDFDRL
jgi:predicted RND superfamily exporter protein